MGNIMEEYGKVVIYAIVGIFILGILSGFLMTQWKNNGVYKDTGHLSGNDKIQASSPLPTITLKSGNKTVRIKDGATFNVRDNVSVTDKKDGTISSDKVDIKIESVAKDGQVTTKKLTKSESTVTGNSNYRYYNVLYKVKNSRGYKAEKGMKLLVSSRDK